MKKFYYHVSSRYFGDKVKLYPLSRGRNRGPYESDHKRICVSDTIERCLIASPCFRGRIYIYRTYCKVEASRPKCKIDDVSVTREKWIERPTTFKLVGSITLPKGILSDNDFSGGETQWFIYGFLKSMNIHTRIVPVDQKLEPCKVRMK